MCGVTGYLGPRAAAPVLLDSLRRLEYRGYDSCGLVVLDDDGIALRRSIEPLERFRTHILAEDLRGTIGLAHTRWATHGAVDTSNAHPHSSCDGTILAVHNGVLENGAELRETLTRQGHRFTSETDSETIPHLVEQSLQDGQTLEEAFASLPRRLVGSYAILLVRAGVEAIYALRRDSPLVIGAGEQEYFPASDIPSFLPLTSRVVYIAQDEPLAIDRTGIYRLIQDTFEVRREPLERAPVFLDQSVMSLSKGLFEHYMLKEILEQAQSLERLIEVPPQILGEAAALLRNATSIKLVGAGTSYHACLFGQHAFGAGAGLDTEACISSEFEFRASLLRPGAVVVALSQSGETADTLHAVQAAEQRGAKVIAITNNEMSSLTQVADLVIPLRSGPEFAVAATKSYTSQLAVLLLLDQAVAPQASSDVRSLWQARDSILNLTSITARAHIAELAHELSVRSHVFLIGRGPHYVTALEAALKLKEVAGLRAEAFHGGEMKHGPLALIEQGTPVVLFYDKAEMTRAEITASELLARGALVFTVGERRLRGSHLHVHADDAGSATAIPQILPLQLLSYEIAKILGKDPDHPRNLAKSVTVM
ncbi:MAG: glutamine--fructose-6-phosphate transaminase (isomerizing) [Thermoplasmata archaeon]